MNDIQRFGAMLCIEKQAWKVPLGIGAATALYKHYIGDEDWIPSLGKGALMGGGAAALGAGWNKLRSGGAGAGASLQRAFDRRTAVQIPETLGAGMKARMTQHGNLGEVLLGGGHRITQTGGGKFRLHTPKGSIEFSPEGIGPGAGLFGAGQQFINVEGRVVAPSAGNLGQLWNKLTKKPIKTTLRGNYIVNGVEVMRSPGGNPYVNLGGPRGKELWALHGREGLTIRPTTGSLGEYAHLNYGGERIGLGKMTPKEFTEDRFIGLKPYEQTIPEGQDWRDLLLAGGLLGGVGTYGYNKLTG